MLYKKKYYKYKEKYLNLKQKGGTNVYLYFDTFEEAIMKLCKEYNDTLTFIDKWFMFGICYKDAKYHIEFSDNSIGSAGLNKLSKIVKNQVQSHKFRPFVKIDNDKENRVKLLKILFGSFHTFLSVDDLAIAGKIWSGNIENCQCGKFFDFFGNYNDIDTFQLFKISMINMSKHLVESGYKKEDRCEVLYPKYLYKNKEEYSSHTFSSGIQKNYETAKTENIYLDAEIPITYRNDEILFSKLYATTFIQELLKKYFLKNDEVIKEANGVLFEKILLDSVVLEYFKNSDIVFNDEESLLNIKALFDFDNDLITNFNSLFKNFWLCNNKIHGYSVNKKAKCFKCNSFVCLSCSMINQNITSNNECIVCFEKYTPEELETIIPN